MQSANDEIRFPTVSNGSITVARRCCSARLSGVEQPRKQTTLTAATDETGTIICDATDLVDRSCFVPALFNRSRADRNIGAVGITDGMTLTFRRDTRQSKALWALHTALWDQLVKDAFQVNVVFHSLLDAGRKIPALKRKTRLSVQAIMARFIYHARVVQDLWPKSLHSRYGAI